MSLTARGWALGLTAIAAAAAAGLFGIQELYPIAAATAALLAFSAIWVWAHRFEVTGERRLHATQIAAGQAAVVELTITNNSRRRSPPLEIREPFDHGGYWAGFRLAPLNAGEQLSTPYRLPPAPRGRHQIGPLQFSLTDPFELIRRTHRGAAATPLTVHPNLAPVHPAPSTSGVDRFGLTGRGAFGPGGEEFSSLRPYREGDDLRRVHWASTARLDQVMVRQTDAVAHPRCTVALDLRGGLWPPALLEDALVAAGSILDAARRAGTEIRLVTTSAAGHDGVDTGFGRTGTHWGRVLDALALADLGPITGEHSASLAAHLGQAGGTASSSGDETLTVIASSRTTQADRGSLARLAPPSSLIVVLFGPDAHRGSAPSTPPGRYLQVTETGTFATTWAELAPLRDRLARR